MTDDANDADRDMTALDDWLGAAGFVDAELDITDWNDLGPSDGDSGSAGTGDDPWADVIIDMPTLTDAQRQFLLGADELAAADAEIIAIPGDPDDIEPFHPDTP